MPASILCGGRTVAGLYRHESHLCQLLCDALAEIPEITVYRQPDVAYVPIVSFTVAGASPEETADYLNRQGFCLRAGLHCAPLAHEKLGTKDGTVRFAPSGVQQGIRYAAAGGKPEKLCQYSEKSRKPIEKFR